MLLLNFFILAVCFLISEVDNTSLDCLFGSYHLDIQQNSPVIRGANITITATLSCNGESSVSGNFKYIWSDNADTKHEATYFSEKPVNTFIVSYPKDSNQTHYEVNLNIEKKIPFFDIYEHIFSKNIDVVCTEYLNGKLIVKRNSSEHDKYLSNLEPVKFEVDINKADLNYIKSNMTNFTTFWFIDNENYNTTNNLTLLYNFTKYIDKNYKIEAVVVVSYNDSLHLDKDVNKTNGTELLKSNTSNTLQNLISNGSKIEPDPNKTYGYFQDEVFVRTPVHDVVVNGTTWLQQGDMLNLSLGCKGTPPFFHCIQYIAGEYNSTGKETCRTPNKTPSCLIVLSRLFTIPKQYTVLFILYNELSKNVYPVGVNIYEVKQEPQISVIVVPVSFSLLAVILIVFGIAYFIQSRNRYTIEVADFDFNQNNDTEYKTFKERLLEALSSAFIKSEEQEYPEEASNVMSSNKKYGSM